MISNVDGSLRGSGYGALEVRQYYQKYMARSLAFSIVLQTVCVTAFHAFHADEISGEPPRIAEFIPYQYLVPPSLLNGTKPSSSSPSLVTKGIERPKFALPIPVPDPFVDPNNTVPSQQKPWANSGTESDGSVFGNPRDQRVTWDDENVEPPPFRPVERMPEIVRRVEPTYPESAVRAGIEGLVVLNIWVDKTGKVRKALFLQSESEILNSSAIDAAMRWVFTPAIMQHGPVSVWVSIPFRFKLRGE